MPDGGCYCAVCGGAGRPRPYHRVTVITGAGRPRPYHCATRHRRGLPAPGSPARPSHAHGGHCCAVCAGAGRPRPYHRAARHRRGGVSPPLVHRPAHHMRTADIVVPYAPGRGDPAPTTASRSSPGRGDPAPTTAPRVIGGVSPPPVHRPAHHMRRARTQKRRTGMACPASSTHRNGLTPRAPTCPFPITLSPCHPVTLSPCHRAIFAFSSSTNTRRRNLPTIVLGSSLRNSTAVGTL